MAAGALATVMVTPQVMVAGPVLSSPVRLLSSQLQPVIDQLLDAQQQITAANSDFPFISPSSLPMLHDYTTMLAGTMLGSELNMLARNQFDDIVFPWAPYPWSANGTDPQPFLTYNNPDNFYSVQPVDPDKTYEITVTPGPGTQDVSFLANAGNGVTVDYQPLVSLHLANATPNADGTYTVIMSSTPHEGNWVDTAGAQAVIVRDTLGNWGQIHDSFSIHEVGGSGAITMPLLSENQISSTLATLAANLPRENLSGSYLGQFQGVDTVPINTFSSIAPTTEHIPGPLLSDQLTSLGHFSLAPDQALIVKVPDIDSSYSSIMLANEWGQTAPFATAFGSLNNTQAFHDADGFTYYVISDQDPGVANWVDNSGLAAGGVWLRWQNITGPVPSTPVTTELVNVADVKNDLPADMPTVTAAERAADLQERLFDYDYAHDQAHGIAWIGANLLYDQMKDAMGADQFAQIFGAQNDVPSVLERLTTLAPDQATVAHDLLANPAGSLAAIINNLPLAVKDIELPTILALERLQQMAALGEGAQGLGTFFEKTLTDPATSITAGLLNARDDLAVAVMNASSGFNIMSPEESPLWESLIQLNQAVLSQLMNSGATASDMAALGADLASNAGGLP